MIFSVGIDFKGLQIIESGSKRRGNNLRKMLVVFGRQVPFHNGQQIDSVDNAIGIFIKDFE
jgi:hypothetical protein